MNGRTKVTVDDDDVITERPGMGAGMRYAFFQAGSRRAITL